MAQQFSQNPLEQYASEKLSVGWPWRFFIISLGIFLLSIVVYFGLTSYYKPLLAKRISAADTEVKTLEATVSVPDREKFARFYSQLINLKNLLSNHVSASRIFLLLEKETHPMIYYKTANLSIADRELELDGVADSYSTLGEQLEAFNQAEEIDSYLIRQSQVEEGVVQFRVVLTLKSNLLK